MVDNMQDMSRRGFVERMSEVVLEWKLEGRLS